MRNTQSTKINWRINFILYGLATRRLSVKKKSDTKQRFFPPCRNWPIYKDDAEDGRQTEVDRSTRSHLVLESGANYPLRILTSQNFIISVFNQQHRLPCLFIKAWYNCMETGCLQFVSTTNSTLEALKSFRYEREEASLALGSSCRSGWSEFLGQPVTAQKLLKLLKSKVTTCLPSSLVLICS